MSLLTYFRRPGARARTQRVPDRRRSRPGVEALENRLVPAAVGTPIQNFVDQVYRDFAGRPPSAAELAAGTAQLEQGHTRFQFVLAVEQLPDSRAREITRYFGRIEEQAPSPAALNIGVTFLESGKTINQYVEHLLDDPAYFRKNGNNLGNFVRDVFEDLFQANNANPADPFVQAENQWLPLLAGRQVSRAQFVHLLTSGLPFRVQLLQDHFQDLLGQSPPSAGLLGLTVFEFRHGDDQTAALIASSDAYFQRAQLATQPTPPPFVDSDRDLDASNDPDGDHV